MTIRHTERQRLSQRDQKNKTLQTRAVLFYSLLFFMCVAIKIVVFVYL